MSEKEKEKEKIDAAPASFQESGSFTRGSIALAFRRLAVNTGLTQALILSFCA